MADMYQVVGDCFHVLVDTAAGKVNQLLYRPAMVPQGVSPERIKHGLSVGLIAKVGGDESEPDSDVTDESPVAVVDPPVILPPVVDDGGNPPAIPETGAGRDAAKALLPADGSAPPKNASQPVWVEYAVVKGYGYDAVSGEKRDALIALTAGK